VFVLQIEDGNADGVDLSGLKAAVAIEAPGDFVSGIDRARLYVDDSAGDEQAAKLETIFRGKAGGVWEPINTMIGGWVPTARARIEMTDGANPGATVGSVGRLSLTPLTTADGKQTKLVNGPVIAGFGVDTIELAVAQDTAWSDPDLRAWESLGYGGRVNFDWRA
jgi:hypothetical protein